MDADLLRQRRNLILVSAMLLVFDFAQVCITKVSVLGTELLVGNVKVLMYCAWVLWAYFILRYYQYWRAEPNRPIRDAFVKRLHKYVKAYAKKLPAESEQYGETLNYKFRYVGFLTWIYVAKQFEPTMGRMVDGPSANLSTWRLALWCLKSVGFVCFQTHHATDHALPFALAFAAPVVTLSAKM